MKNFKIFLLASMVILFTACGGGSSSGGSAPSNPETPQTIAIAKIMLYANDNNRPAPTVEDYADASVTGVTADNIADINAEVAGLTAEEVNTTEKIQALVDDLPPPDTTAPVITIKGNNPETVTQGDTYTDAGATATDNIDGTVTVTTTGSVDTSIVGTYTITYTAKDNAGNSAKETRTVSVVHVVVKFLDLMKQPAGNDAKVLFTYDGDGNRLTEKRDPADGYSVWNYVSYESQYSYDFNTNKATETWIKRYRGPDYLDEIGTSIYTFDDKGVVLKIFINSDLGYHPTDVVYTYDDLGNIKTLSSKREENPKVSIFNTYTYDENGNRLTSEKRVDAPNSNFFSWYTYDTNGNVLTESWVNEEGISVEGAYTYIYDAFGNLITEEFKRTYSNGLGDNEKTTTYTYDANGNLITEESASTHLDYQGSVWENMKATYTYDANGNLITRESTSTYAGASWENIKATRTYDANGNLITGESASTTSYGSSSHYIHTYDANGNLTEESANTDSGGSWRNTKSTYTYDANGNLITRESTSTSSDGSSYHYIHTYDANGNLITRESTSTSSNGSWENIKSTYTYDANGNLITGESTRTYSSGSWGNTKDTYTYDANGNLITDESASTYSDGSSSHSIHTYDANGKLITRELANTYLDGSWSNTKSTRTYDANGNLITDESASTYSDGSAYSSSLTYDSSGTLRSYTTLDTQADGSWEKHTKTYDENGTLIDEKYENG